MTRSLVQLPWGGATGWRSTTSPRLRVAGGLLVALGAATVFFAHLNYPLLEPDEGRYAEIPLLMMQAGDYAAPRLQNQPYLDKPPLIYWLVAGSYRLFGVHEWSARLAAAVAAWLTVLATYCWSCRWFGFRAAMLTGLILCTSLGFARFGRTLIPDAPLALSVALALWSGHTAIAGQRRFAVWWLISAGFCGLGLLAKGPVAAVLVLPCLLAVPWIHRGIHGPGLYAWSAYGAAALAIAAPWYLWAHWNLPGFTAEFFWRHNLVRYAAPFQHGKPWWYYAPAFLAEQLPWTPLFLTIPFLWAGRRHVRAPALFCLVATAWCIFFFSTAGCKVPYYLLPAMPMSAGLLGFVLKRIVFPRRPAPRGRWPALRSAIVGRWVPATTVTLLVIAAAIWLHQHGGLVAPYLLAGLAPLLFALALKWGMHMAWTCCGIVGSALVMFWIWQAVPANARQISTGRPARHIARLAERDGAAIAAYRGTWDAAGFYRGGPEVPIIGEPGEPTIAEFVQLHAPAWLLAREHGDRTQQLQSALPAGTLVDRIVRIGSVTGFHIIPQPSPRGAAAHR